MKLLLDTHTILCLVNEHEKLSTTAKALLSNDEHSLYISMASLWEVAIKTSLGKLIDFPSGVRALMEQIEDMPIEILPITKHYIEIVESLPFIHRDPFDRVIVATAQSESMSIITADENIPKYSISYIW
ncbi:MAG: type II toxin-antitoxin system VapC family toxin [Oscillospiraceae bacterium]|nr:type II toxin-antitoxin system VapC family toxin [Oscillospiraceae bacterium]